MPYVYVYQCPQCRFDLELVICREFQRDREGLRTDFEYPNPDLYEWPPRRVSGLWSRLWCPACRAVRTHVVVELNEPAEHPVQAFLRAEAQGLTGLEGGPCPECGAAMVAEAEGCPCPACDAGALHCIGEYEP